MKQLVEYQAIVNIATARAVFIAAYATSGLFCNFICYASTLDPAIIKLYRQFFTADFNNLLLRSQIFVFIIEREYEH
jgi:hypothetical protein